MYCAIIPRGELHNRTRAEVEQALSLTLRRQGMTRIPALKAALAQEARRYLAELRHRPK